MSREGIKELREYLGANDTSVFEPLFIAQYLLCPVNTIVQDGLLDWMMKKYLPTTLPEKMSDLPDKIKSKFLKSEWYLKYTLLVDLIKIVSKHGREPDYNWVDNEDLNAIKEGPYGVKESAKNKT